MARPARYDLRYFPLDVDAFDDPKFLLIEEDYGVKGGYLAIRLMAMVYEKDGYFLEWKDQSEFTCAKRVGNGYTGALVRDVLHSCLKHGLFDKASFNKHKILTSHGIQKRWLEVSILLRRHSKIKSEYWLIDSEEMPVTSELTRITSEETTTPATLTPPKEIKLKEIKVKEKITVAPATPSPPKSVDNSKSKKEEAEPFWQLLVDVWFDFGKQKFREEPSFSGQDPKIFKRLIALLKKRAAQKNVEWNETNGPQRLRHFLNSAFEDQWLSEHFLLSNLEKQFDKIIQRQAVSVKKITGAASSQDIEYLYERFLEGNLESKFIAPEHYDDLKEKGLLVISKATVAQRINNLIGSVIFSESELCKDYQANRRTPAIEADYPQLKRTAVIEYFKKLKSEGKTNIINGN